MDVVHRSDRTHTHKSIKSKHDIYCRVVNANLSVVVYGLRRTCIKFVETRVVVRDGQSRFKLFKRNFGSQGN
ncbi:hypothetical protein SCA6_002233 [Theobroma cacao]